MTTTTLAYRVIHNKINRITSLNFPHVNWKAIYLLSILFSSLMLIFYVYSINELTEGAYLIKKYNKEIDMISDENVKLQANFANTSFLGQVQNKAKDLSFEKTKEVKYVEILDSSLAKQIRQDSI